ncbi:hypothetical protein [Streptomyces sp. NPDC018693]|uniref:hypothetical protein n=1 Tax=unclassified Streptomyces TaxID=2593676 RepID=UPI00379EC5C3
MRRTGLVGVAVAAVLVMGAGSARAGVVPEADLAYHGSAVLEGGRAEVRMTPRNHGPSAVADATVRLRWSVPLEERAHALPAGCVRTGARDVVCRTGALDADGLGDQLVLGVWLRGRPAEVTLEIDTVWSGDAVDRNRGNDRQRVLVLDTGDRYYF